LFSMPNFAIFYLTGGDMGINRSAFLTFFVICLLTVMGCGVKSEAAPAIIIATGESVAAAQEQDIAAIEEATPTAEVLPALPQEMNFTSTDGVELSGMYYPAAVNPAPLVVFFHWVNSDQYDWLQIALWLQNRGQTGTADAGYFGEWHDPTWFPNLPEERSYAVFTFSYRGCVGAGGCSGFDRAAWLIDSQAAVSYASQLPGIDPKRIVAIGASIGADGAADACAWLNDQPSGATCVGVISLSPGDYLTQDYVTAVQSLEEDSPPVPAWCFYGIADGPSRNECKSATGSAYQAFEYPGENHGMFLLIQNLEPLPMQLVLDFLYQVTGQ
jgi:dienelactone hydrolase